MAIFTVTGTGTFPYDMLRYDSCWPQCSADAHKLGCVYCNREDGQADSRRTVMLKSAHAPTHRRWESFGWKVNIA
jgi:hypothetical protein